MCLKRVFRCVTGEQIAQRGAQGQCVAIFPAESTEDEDDDGGLLGALVRVEDI